MTEQTANVRVTFSALLATLFILGLGVALGVARMHPLPGVIITVNGTIMTVGLFAAPLVWWRQKTGYACAMAVGAVSVVINLAVIMSGLPFVPGILEGTIALVASQAVVSLLVLVYAARAWRER